MPQPTSAVNEPGNEVTPPVESAPTDNDTSTVSDQPSNVNPLDELDGDSWLNDVDNANPIKPNGNTDEPDAEDLPAEGGETEVNKPEDTTDADKPKEGDQVADADKPADDTKPSAKDARVEQLTKDISDLKAGLGLEPNADVRSLVAERNALKEMQEAQIRKAGLDLEKELLNMTDPDTGEAYSPDKAARIARTATIEAEGTVASQEAYDLSVERNQQTMERDTLRAMKDFPIFMRLLPGVDPKLPDGTDNPAAINPEYDAELAELAGQHLNDAFVLEDSGRKGKDGKPIMVVVNIKRSPYEIMKSVADQATRLKSQSQADKDKAEADAEARAASNIAKQSAGADVPVSGNTSSNRNDAAGADFDEAFDAYDG